MLSIEDAWSLIASRVEPLGMRPMPPGAADRHVLAKPVLSEGDTPPFNTSAMDGYALAAEDTESASPDSPVILPVTLEVAAGRAPNRSLKRGEAFGITTGAPVPAGANAVLALEAGRLRGGVLQVRQPVPVGRHVRKAGEDVRAGTMLMDSPRVLTPQRIGLLASNGIAEVETFRRPTVAICATGSELVQAGRPLRPGQIYDSNRSVMKSLMARDGFDVADHGIVADSRDTTRAALANCMESDVTLVSGGVSVGKHDYVKDVLGDLGVERVFWRVRMKPGKPLYCGVKDGHWVFGLPGNPISCVVGYLMFVVPVLRMLQGLPFATPYRKSVLSVDVRRTADRTVLLTARTTQASNGTVLVTPTVTQGSAMMCALAEADCFVVVPLDRETIPAGSTVDTVAIGSEWIPQ